MTLFKKYKLPALLSSGFAAFSIRQNLTKDCRVLQISTPRKIARRAVTRGAISGQALSPAGKISRAKRVTSRSALLSRICVPLSISPTGHSLKSVEAILEHYVARTRAQANAAIHKSENARRTNSANQVANHGKNSPGGNK